MITEENREENKEQPVMSLIFNRNFIEAGRNLDAMMAYFFKEFLDFELHIKAIAEQPARTCNALNALNFIKNEVARMQENYLQLLEFAQKDAPDDKKYDVGSAKRYFKENS